MMQLYRLYDGCSVIFYIEIGHNLPLQPLQQLGAPPGMWNWPEDGTKDDTMGELTIPNDIFVQHGGVGVCYRVCMALGTQC